MMRVMRARFRPNLAALGVALVAVALLLNCGVHLPRRLPTVGLSFRVRHLTTSHFFAPGSVGTDSSVVIETVAATSGSSTWYSLAGIYTVFAVGMAARTTVAIV